MRRAIVFAVLLSLPLSALAEDGFITRRDGFLMMWQSLRRPAAATRETPFRDVSEGDPGFVEITYAKSRNILDSSEESPFYPNDPLQLRDALVWLLRTRNVDDPDTIQPGTLSGFLLRYQIADLSTDASLMQEQLITLMRSLDQALAEETHEVSLYAENFHGRGTAFGETFDMHALTAAHRTFPHNTLVRVTNKENGKTVVVRINDRGPFVIGRDMDLSLGAFTAIAERSKGKILATFERLGDASLVDGCDTPVPRYQERLTRSVRLQRGVPHIFSLGGTLELRANRPFVVRSIGYPNGSMNVMQDWILEGEHYALKPSMTGVYHLRLGTVEGRVRTMRMKVIECGR